MPRIATTHTCRNCETRFTLDRDEDGYTELPTHRCADPNCSVRLCPCCPQFQCAGCGEAFCLEHAIEEEQDFDCSCVQTDVDQFDARWCLAHNTSIRPRPLKFCVACWEEAESDPSADIHKLDPVSALRVPEWVEGGAA
jgi:hypothetical protein